MKSSGGEETGEALEDGQAPEEGIVLRNCLRQLFVYSFASLTSKMVKKKFVELRESWDDVKSSSKTNFGKSLLARLREFKEKGRRGN